MKPAFTAIRNDCLLRTCTENVKHKSQIQSPGTCSIQTRECKRCICVASALLKCLQFPAALACCAPAFLRASRGRQCLCLSLAWLALIFNCLLFSPPSRGTQARLPSSSSTLSIAEVFLHASWAASPWQQLSSTSTCCHATCFLLPAMIVASCSAWNPSCRVMHAFLKCTNDWQSFLWQF